MNVTTLSELLQANRGAPRSITYYEGEQQRRVVRYSELHERALGILHHLQRLGARPGDRLLLFLSNNERQFGVGVRDDQDSVRSPASRR